MDMNVVFGKSVIAGLLLLMLDVGSAECRTWRVERDGSGDFKTIRPAIAASAPGDTVLLGPGRYTEVEPLVLPGWTELTYVPVTVDSLTLIGVDRETVIIGPTEPEFTSLGPKGIATTLDITWLVVEELTVENVRDGMYLPGRADVQDCVVRDCYLGINFWGVGSSVRECTIQGNTFAGLITFTGCRDLAIENCQFIDNNLGVGVNRTQNVTINSSSFLNSTWSTTDIQYSENSTGTVVDCTFNGSQSGVGIRSESVVVLERNDFRDHEYALYVYDGSVAHGTKNVFRGSYTAVRFASTSTAFLSNNHILKSEGWAVRCDGFNLHDVDIDLRNNYWGIDNADSISAWIFDGNDPQVPYWEENMSNVLYEPFSPVPVEAKESSVGGFKSLFRRN